MRLIDSMKKNLCGSPERRGAAAPKRGFPSDDSIDELIGGLPGDPRMPKRISKVRSKEDGARTTLGPSIADTKPAVRHHETSFNAAAAKGYTRPSPFGPIAVGVIASFIICGALFLLNRAAPTADLRLGQTAVLPVDETRFSASSTPPTYAAPVAILPREDGGAHDAGPVGRGGPRAETPARRKAPSLGRPVVHGSDNLETDIGVPNRDSARDSPAPARPEDADLLTGP